MSKIRRNCSNFSKFI